MASEDIPEEVRQFLFEYVDSVELLEVLLFLRNNNQTPWTAQQISQELRSNVGSVINRLTFLKSIHLIEEKEKDHFIYSSEKYDTLITSLNDAYRVRRHSVLQIIFSPMKKAKQLANAFMFSSNSSKKGDSDG